MNYSPYAPPRTDGYAPPVYAPPAVYGPLGWKTTATIVGAIAMTVFSVLQTILGLVAPQTVGGATPHVSAVDILRSLLNMVGSAVGIGTMVFFLLWIHQAATNVRAFGQQGLTHSPGWCVGWWFIPFANWWKPYTAMREIWRASDPDTVGAQPSGHWTSVPVAGILPLWWGMYLFHGVVSAGFAVWTIVGLIQQMIDAIEHSSGGSLPEMQMTMSPGMLVANALYMVACALFVMVVRQVAARQHAAWAKISAAGA